MACPACDHTMQRLAPEVYWCPRCGTIKTASDIEQTKLVKRCRDFEAEHIGPTNGAMFHLWYCSGISESIHRPENRREPIIMRPKQEQPHDPA